MWILLLGAAVAYAHGVGVDTVTLMIWGVTLTVAGTAIEIAWVTRRTGRTVSPGESTGVGPIPSSDPGRGPN